MKLNTRSVAVISVLPKTGKTIALLLLAGLVALPGNSQEIPGKHPFFIHALTDLRTARWLLQHQPGDRKVYSEEDVAIQEIDAAIHEIKRAAIDDGKDIDTHQNVDVKQQGSRLLRAMETLRKAHADIDQEEDNPTVRELRRRASEHIERATTAADRAHAAWLKDTDR